MLIQPSSKTVWATHPALSPESGATEAVTGPANRPLPKTTRFLIEPSAPASSAASPITGPTTKREAVRDAIETNTLCRERHLEKGQIMLNLELLLTNLHDWACEHCFAPEWQTLQLETTTQLIYQKSGRIRWDEDRIEVELIPYYG